MEEIREFIKVICLGIAWYYAGYAVCRNKYKKELDRLKKEMNKYCIENKKRSI